MKNIKRYKLMTKLFCSCNDGAVLLQICRDNIMKFSPNELMQFH
jgi:hypothetical protein